MRTVLEVSKELNITTQAVYKKIKQTMVNELEPFIIRDNKGNIQITDDGVELIRNSLPMQKNIDEPTPNDLLIDNLLKEIEFLKMQIETKDNQLNEKDNRLKQKDDFIENQADKSDKLMENMQILLKQSQEIALLNAPKANKNENEDIGNKEDDRKYTWGERVSIFLKGK